MKVSAIMTSQLIVVSPETSLDEAIKLMDESRVRHLPVLEKERLVGVISDRAVLKATGWLPARVLEVFNGEHSHLSVGEVMTSPAVSVDAEATVVSACLDMLGRSIGCLPVVSEGKLVGMLSEMDVLALYIRHCGGGRFDPLIEEHMTHEVTSVKETVSLKKAAQLMLSMGVRHLPVLEAGRLIGILSDRDLQRGVGSGRSAESPVEEVMSKTVFGVRSDEHVSRAAELMLKHRISALPIVEDDQLEGMLSMADIFDLCLDGLRQPEQVRTR